MTEFPATQEMHLEDLLDGRRDTSHGLARLEALARAVGRSTEADKLRHMRAETQNITLDVETEIRTRGG